VDAVIADLRAKEKRPAFTKDQKEELAAADKVKEWLAAGKDVRFGEWSAREIEFLNATPMITAKPVRRRGRGRGGKKGWPGGRARGPPPLSPRPTPPRHQVVYLVNLTEKAYVNKKSKWLPKVHAWVAEHGGEPIIPFSGALESRLFDMPDDEKAATCAELGVASALPKIITAGFKAVRGDGSAGVRVAAAPRAGSTHPPTLLPTASPLSAGPVAVLFHGGRGRGEVLANPARRQGAAGRGHDSHRL